MRLVVGTTMMSLSSARAVHLVERLEQQRVGVGMAPLHALTGDQVDVLDHHHRRLEAAAQDDGPARQVDSRTAVDDVK
jgi:hypothetical protein